MSAEPIPPPLEPMASAWRREPFRIFFPLGVLLAWIGVGHWVFYATGLSATYSCMFHALVQMQAFMMSFAIGFLLTALPRRTQTAPVSLLELVMLTAALLVIAGSAVVEFWLLTEIAYIVVFAVLLQFAIRRFRLRAAGRRPPAAFVLIPFACMYGVAGAMLIAAVETGAPVAMSGLGRLLVQQGVFLCLTVGIGGLVLPLMSGASPPPDLGSSPGEMRKALAYGAAGVAIGVSLVLEYAGWVRTGPLLRAAVAAAGLGFGAGAWYPPGRPGLHRILVWISAWMIPAGLGLAALWPDYRVPALHIVFIGGFSMMAFGVATHVTVSHLDMPDLAAGRPAVVVTLAVTFLLALIARFIADWSETYFAHLGWAAGLWIAGSATWVAYFGPKLLTRH